MKRTLSCRSGVFGEPARAFVTLAQCGITNVEPNVPADGNYRYLKEQADAAGVTITTLSTGVNLDEVASCAAFREMIDGAAEIGTPRIFCSLQSKNPSDAEVIGRLQELADHAAKCDILLGMETHPPFGTNAGTALQTIEIIGRASLGFNFDTANIYYYNHGLDTVKELTYCREKVVSVHLKDSDGIYHSMGMPLFGTGVVNFPEVFRLLDEIGFDGPCTMELEGSSLENHPGGKVDFLKRCLDYLREIGAI